MRPNDIHESIAQQVDHMKPANLVPGRDVGIKIVNETTVAVYVNPTRTRVEIELDLAADEYNVTVHAEGSEPVKHEGVYCDMLGELVFGPDAKPWTQPFGCIMDGDGNVISEF